MSDLQTVLLDCEYFLASDGISNSSVMRTFGLKNMNIFNGLRCATDAMWPVRMDGSPYQSLWKAAAIKGY
ncbi:hypothetical protein EMGBS15_04700 [Filimonas sp.]|nr:hypothetical protein EMGBS15_04700 [Filimonas sp.]